MQPLPDEFDILHYVRITYVRKKSDAAAFIIRYTRCEEHIEYNGNAPVVIMVINTNGKSPFSPLNDDERFTEINDSMSIGASIENMLICAEEIGIGSLWIGNTCFAYKELADYLKINDCGQLIGAVVLGYKAQNPSARPRKNIEEIVEYYN